MDCRCRLWVSHQARLTWGFHGTGSQSPHKGLWVSATWGCSTERCSEIQRGMTTGLRRGRAGGAAGEIHHVLVNYRGLRGSGRVAGQRCLLRWSCSPTPSPATVSPQPVPICAPEKRQFGAVGGGCSLGQLLSLHIWKNRVLLPSPRHRAGPRGAHRDGPRGPWGWSPCRGSPCGCALGALNEPASPRLPGLPPAQHRSSQLGCTRLSVQSPWFPLGLSPSLTQLPRGLPEVEAQQGAPRGLTNSSWGRWATQP